MHGWSLDPVSRGVVALQKHDPYSTFRVLRVDRREWGQSPDESGIYLLWGVVDGRATAYIGMSTVSVRDRIQSHHVDTRRNWFGILFAVPAVAALCPAVEAELIRRAKDAGVVNVTSNRLDESRWLDSEIPQVEHTVEQVVEAIELLASTDIFTPETDVPATGSVARGERRPRYARVYLDGARSPRARTAADPEDADHAFAGPVEAWGRFEADQPDTRFRVLAGSQWRAARPNAEHVQNRCHLSAQTRQEVLVEAEVLDPQTMTLTRDHVFPNWTEAAVVTSGIAQYNGSRRWQRIGSSTHRSTLPR